MTSANRERTSVLEVVELIDAWPIGPDEGSLLRKHGIYTQRPPADGFFMVRVRVPRGELTSIQLRAIADAANEYGRGLADITVRQNIQLHWINREALPRLLQDLDSAGLSTSEPRGGAIRNIVTCPVSGFDEDDLCDTDHLVRQVSDLFTENPEFASLPRKLKVTVTGCAVRCVYPEVNDLAIFAVPDFERGGILFRTRVGGGLSTRPRFSQDLGILIEPDDVVELCSAIAVTLRDWDKDGRGATRLHYFMAPSDVPRFRDAVQDRLRRTLRLAAEADALPILERDRSHIGIHGQKVTGLYYIGLSIVGGRTSGASLRRLADLAEEYGSGRIKTASSQNAILRDVPEWNLLSATRELDLAGFDYQPQWSRKGVIACTGIQFCKLALTETKNRADSLAEYLENALDMDDPVRISVTGCPNACGQHHISDVGLEGCLTTINGSKRESFQVLLGGGVGKDETMARRIGLQIPAERLAESLTQLFRRYKENRFEGETFQEFCLRHNDRQLIECLTPSESPPVSGVQPDMRVNGAEFGSCQASI